MPGLRCSAADRGSKRPGTVVPSSWECSLFKYFCVERPDRLRESTQDVDIPRFSAIGAIIGCVSEVNYTLGVRNWGPLVLELTRKKLREAGFFLRLLKEQESRIFRPEPEARDFYLSAFLSAARSVGDVVKVEEGERYRAWFEKRRKTLTAEEQEILTFTNRQRVESVHVRGPKVETHVTDVPVTELQRELHVAGGSLFINPGGVPGEPAPMPTTQRTTMVFSQYPNTNVGELCQRYLDFLVSTINEYEGSTLPPNNVLQPIRRAVTGCSCVRVECCLVVRGRCGPSARPSGDACVRRPCRSGSCSIRGRASMLFEMIQGPLRPERG